MDEQYDSIIPVTIFYSYANEDETLRNKLEKHLSLLQRQGIITAWYDRLILPGMDWAHNISKYLNEASIILLLISSDFLASDYCYNIEMQQALERQKAGEARVIPIILRPVDWQNAPFAYLQCLPLNGKPVIEWENQDAAFLDITKSIHSAIKHLHSSSSQKYQRLSSASRQSRERQLKRVYTYWIKGVLEHSLHNAILIALGLDEQPDALHNPWRLVMESEWSAHPLPLGTHITQVYDSADGKLLILGEPGAGKTTLLLELARDLLDRAEHDGNHPIPVVFNLSSWAIKRQPLADWLVEDLYVKYQVPRKVGQEWVAQDQVLLLLDGLDEVAAMYRSACVEAINIYRQEHDLVSVVICSRKAEYLAQSARMLLDNAVVVQPLTDQQIDEYLSAVGGQLEALHTALQTELRELATTPLMLSVLILTYHEKLPANISITSSIEIQRRQVFDSYIQRMLKWRGTTDTYAPEQTIRWLTWLAQQLLRHNQTTFYLEWIQPSWLSDTWLRWVYKCIAGRPLIGLLLGSLGASVSGTVGVILSVLLSKIVPGLDHVLISELVGAFIAGPFAGLIIGLQTLDEGLLSGLYIGIITTIAGIIGGSLIGRFIGLSLAGQDIALVGELTGMLTGMLAGIFVGALVGKSAFKTVTEYQSHAEIEPAGTISWSWARMRRAIRPNGNVFIGGLIGIIICSSFIMLTSGIEKGPIIGVIDGLISGLIATPFLFIASGLWYDTLDKRILSTPNQGIWLSAHNIISIALPFSLSAGLGAGVVFVMIIGPLIGLEIGLIAWLFSWLCSGLYLGGFVYIQHFTLRYLLWCAGHTPSPPNYVDFLDYAAERSLLRKVGGGYIFIHGLLLDYFASLRVEE
jgi:eukaryotic-like serine/threonine-protein kinase